MMEFASRGVIIFDTQFSLEMVTDILNLYTVSLFYVCRLFVRMASGS